VISDPYSDGDPLGYRQVDDLFGKGRDLGPSADVSERLPESRSETDLERSGEPKRLQAKSVKMKCPVCASEAWNRTPLNFDGYVIECPICGKYEVAGGAWERFKSASSQEWSAALAKARSVKGFARWPTIKRISF
jgi:ribosomal protein L37AE/L43A